MTIAEARRVGPGLILVPQNPDIYRRPYNALLGENGTVIAIDTVKSIDALTRGLDDSGRRDPELFAARPTAAISDNLADRAIAERSEHGTILGEGEHRRNQHSAGRRPGFREFSMRRGRNERSRGSLSIASRRGGGTDCARSRRAVSSGGQGSSRGGASGRPSSWSDPLDAVRTRHARCGPEGEEHHQPLP
jgi:hypothetical protein